MATSQKFAGNVATTQKSESSIAAATPPPIYVDIPATHEDAVSYRPNCLDIIRELTPGATYLMQAGMSFAVILFCMIQLGRGEESNAYLPVITGTAAYWLPNPKTADATKVKERAENTVKTNEIHARLGAIERAANNV
jgi:hypothetical protein